MKFFKLEFFNSMTGPVTLYVDRQADIKAVKSSAIFDCEIQLFWGFRTLLLVKKNKQLSN